MCEILLGECLTVVYSLYETLESTFDVSEVLEIHEVAVEDVRKVTEEPTIKYK